MSEYVAPLVGLITICAVWAPVQIWWQRSVPEDQEDPGAIHGCGCSGACQRGQTGCCDRV